MNKKNIDKMPNSKEIDDNSQCFNTETNLKMFDDLDEIYIDKESNLSVKRKIIEENKNKFHYLNSIKSSNRNSLNRESEHAEDGDSQVDNNTNFFKICKPKATINLISKTNINSPHISEQSSRIKYLKDNILLKDSNASNLRHFSSSSLTSNEHYTENSYYRDVKVDQNLLNKSDDREYFRYKNANRNERQHLKKLERNVLGKEVYNQDIIIKSKEIPIANTAETRKNTKLLEPVDINNYIKLLLTRSDKDFSQHLPNELKFIIDIHKHENRLTDDVEISSLFNKYQVSLFFNTLITILAMASGILYYELKLQASLTSSENVLTACLIVCSVANVLFIINSVLVCLVYLRLKKALSDYSKQDNFWNTYLWIYLLCEIIFSFGHPNIFCKDIYFTTNVDWYLLEVEYCLNDYLMIILMMKIYVIFRSVISLSDFAKERADRVMKMFGSDSSILFAIKCMIKLNPFSVIFFFFISCNLILSYLIRIIEGPVFLIDLDSQANLVDFRSFANCMWYTFITMATVGYGDYYAKTNLGRFVGVMDALIGTIFLSLFIIYLQRALSLNQVERTSVNFLNRMKYKEMIKKKTSLFFLNTYRYNNAKKKYLNELNNPLRDEKKIEKYKNDVESMFYKKMSFKKSLKRDIQNIYELPNDYDLMSNKIKDTEDKIDILKEQGNRFKNSLSEIAEIIRSKKLNNQ